MKDGLTDRQREEIRTIAAGFVSIERVLLFGSRAKGTNTSVSDVDLALIGDKVTLKEQIRMSSRLNEGRSLLKYDVIRFSTIKNENLVDQINKDGVVIFDRDSIEATKENIIP